MIFQSNDYKIRRMYSAPWTADDLHVSFIHRFDRVAVDLPSKVAIPNSPDPLTYRDLAVLSRSVAAGLPDPDPRHPVALLTRDPLTTLCAMLGALRNGNVYFVPAPDQPPTRLRRQLSVANAGGVVADADLLPLAREAADGLCAVQRYREAPVSGFSGFEGETRTGTDPAALMFTSGSTGEPKAIVWRHKNLLHKAWACFIDQELGTDDVYANLFSFAFGNSTATTYTALLSGAAVTLFPLVEHGLQELRTHLDTYRVSALFPPVAVFRTLLASSGPETFRHIRILSVDGDRVHVQDLENWKAAFPEAGVFHYGYSSTETNTIARGVYRHDTEIHFPLLPLTRPASDKRIRLLDPDGNPVPDGETGEIAVQSEFLCGGYWNDPAATAARFLPASDGSGECLYLTGDLGWWDAEGRLFLAGRRDHQVKVRGYRIETGEIEARLLAQPGVRETAVTAEEDFTPEDKRLTAWFTTDPDADAAPSRLRAALAAEVPAYMLPSSFVRLEGMPHTANGKIDRKRLVCHSTPQTDVRAPGSALTPVESRLAALWIAHLPEVNEVRPEDSYFDLGGTSLSALGLLDGIHEGFGPDLSLPFLYEHPTLGEVAARIETEDAPTSFTRSLDLQPEGELPPLFCIPGMGSDATSLRDVAAAFPPDRPFIGLQYPGADRPAERCSSHTQLARLLAEEIERRRPQGLVHIGGSSGGGVTAIELACLLRDRGRDVGLVCLLDTRCRAPNALPRWKRALLPLLPAGETVLNRDTLRAGRRQRRIRQEVERLAKDPSHPADGFTREQRYLLLLNAAARADRAHRHRVYTGDALLLRAEQPRSFLAQKASDLGWTPWLPRLIVEATPGHHGRHIRNPNAPVLARTLLRHLDRMEQDRTRPEHSKTGGAPQSGLASDTAQRRTLIAWSQLPNL